MSRGVSTQEFYFHDDDLQENDNQRQPIKLRHNLLVSHAKALVQTDSI